MEINGCLVSNGTFLIVKGMFRLCQDNKWRAFCHFGTYKECVKEYRSLGFAKRKAKRVGGRVVRIPEGVTVEAGGFCYDADGPRNIEEFLVGGT